LYLFKSPGKAEGLPIVFNHSAISELFLFSNALTKGTTALFRSQPAHFGAKSPFILPIFAILRRRLNSYILFYFSCLYPCRLMARFFIFQNNGLPEKPLLFFWAAPVF
jgi:hypothetical protein